MKKNKQKKTHIFVKQKYLGTIFLETKQFFRTGSVSSRGSDESKSRRGFGSLLRRHTSFGAPDAAAQSHNRAIIAGNSTIPSAAGAANNTTNSLPSNCVKEEKSHQ